MTDPKKYEKAFGLDIPFDEAVARFANVTKCQSASDRDPRSASKRDPFVLRFERLALAPSELVGVAETARARIVVRSSSRLLKCQLSLPVSTMSQWGVRRSSRAVVILASPKTVGGRVQYPVCETMARIPSSSTRATAVPRQRHDPVDQAWSRSFDMRMPRAISPHPNL